MAILVLGGAGYIGSHTVRALVEADRDVVVADNLSTGFRAAVDPAARFYRADIRDRAAMDRLFAEEDIDGVIHFAASSQVGESMENPLKYYDNNLGGTLVLLKAMVAAGVNALVFSSTAAVYGEPVQTPIQEDDPTCPTNCYGATKLAMEQMIAWTAKAHGLRYTALRYFNACGAHPSGEIGEAHDPESHLIPIVLQAAAGQRDTVDIYGGDYPTRDGTCVRDYIHVSDLATAHVLALDRMLAGGESGVFNLGNGVGFTVREVIDCAGRVTGLTIPARLSPRRAGDPAGLVASSERAKAELGWRPVYGDLEEIVASAWRWHREHPQGYGDKKL